VASSPSGGSHTARASAEVGIPFIHSPSGVGYRNCDFLMLWVQPQLMARVRHLAGSKYLRHATIQGMR